MAESYSFSQVAGWLMPNTECSDPRDKIYGTLALASEWRELDRGLLPVDYTKSVAEIYLRATKCALNVSGKLDILTTLSQPESTYSSVHDLPSWCPDYSTTCPALTLRRGFATAVFKDFWRASGASIFKPCSMEPLQELSVRGKLCDTIVAEADLRDLVHTDEKPTFSKPFQLLADAVAAASPQYRQVLCIPRQNLHIFANCGVTRN